MPTWGTPLKNNLPATQGAAIKAMLDFLGTNGYTFPWYTDGTAGAVNGSPGTNPITATMWNNNASCGVVIHDPGGGEVTLQRGATANEIRFVAADVVGFHDGWHTFKASVVSGEKFTVNDGTTTKQFAMVAGSGADIVVACSVGATAAAQETAFLAVANGAGLAGTFIGLGTGTVYFVKTARSGVPVYAQTSGTPLAAWAPGATKLPVGYGGQGTVLRGGSGTDQTPVFESRLSGFAGATYLNGVVSTSAPYVWFFWGKAAGNNQPTFVLMQDRVSGPHSVGQYSDAVYGISSGASCWLTSSISKDDACCSGWNGNLSNKGWGYMQAGYQCLYVSSVYYQAYPSYMPVNPADSKDHPDTIMWVRASSGGTYSPPTGPKGESTVATWNGCATSSTIAQGTRFDGVSTGDRVLVGDFLANGWDNTAVT